MMKIKNQEKTPKKRAESIKENLKQINME